MARIKVTPSSLREQAQNLSNLRVRHDDVYAQIKTLVNNLATEWEGSANVAFASSFTENDPHFRRFATDIDSFVERMRRAATDLETAESQVARNMRG